MQSGMVRSRFKRGHPSNAALICLIIFLVFPCPAKCQSTRESVFLDVPLKVDVEFVTLNFSVRDRDQHYVDNLRKEDFLVSEDGVPRPIDHFDSESVPLSVVILLDLSNSTKTLFSEMKTASGYINNLLHTQDEAAVVAFSNYPLLIDEFSRNQRYLPLLLESTFWEFSGATNIYDSVYLASRKLVLVGPEKRRAIILLSDGQGNRGQRERALKALKDSQATLLGISVGKLPAIKGGSGIFRQLARVSGGNALHFGPQLAQEVQASLQRLRSSYVIGFVSSHKKEDGHIPQLRLAISQDSAFAPLSLVLEGGQGLSNF